MLIAAVADQVYEQGRPIHLLNVAFENTKVKQPSSIYEFEIVIIVFC